MELIEFGLPLLVAAAVSFLITGVVVKFGKRLKIVDDPQKHLHPKVVHSTPVPRGGGIPIFIALVVAGMLFMPASGRWVGILIAAGMLALVGYLDDRFEELISPYLRLVINVVAALILIAVGIGIAYINNPLGGLIYLDWPRWCLAEGRCIWILADLFALIWLVGMQNIVGWSSGVDGQLSSFVVIAAVVMALLGIRFGNDPSQLPVVILGAIVAGSYLGFLPWNWYPQKIIPGYGGKSLAGLLLGVLAILSGAKVGAMLMVLGIPIIDAFLVIVKRIKEGRSPVWGGREHFHHYLLDSGWSKRQIAILYMSVSTCLGLLALILKSGSKYFTMATIAALIAGVIIWLHYFSTYLKQPDRDSG